jgi:CubicO group peptidase (beta-lactamase class C family)
MITSRAAPVVVPKSDPNRPEESGGARKREERHPAYTDTPCRTRGSGTSPSRQEKEREGDDDVQQIQRPAELVQFAIEGSPAFDPGTEFQYSNTNTVLLGLGLQQATGEPIGDLYRERIIEPLGLRETSFTDAADSSLPDPHAQGYTPQGQDDGEIGNATNWNPSCERPAGAMISTVEDCWSTGGRWPPERGCSHSSSRLCGSSASFPSRNSRRNIPGVILKILFRTGSLPAYTRPTGTSTPPQQATGGGGLPGSVVRLAVRIRLAIGGRTR